VGGKEYPMLAYSHKRDGATLIVIYSGTLTESLPPPLPGCDKGADGTFSAVIIDMAGVDYINSLGVSSFLENVKYLKARDVNVALCSVTPLVLKVLKLARTDLIIPIASDRLAAKDILFKMLDKRIAEQREYILIIQNNLPLQENLREILRITRQEPNYIIITALNPERGWKLLGGRKIQLILFDVTFPMQEGQTFLKRVRTNRETNGIPFLVVADEDGLPDAAYYTKSGADDMIRFPFNPYETPVRIRTALTLFYNWQAKQESEKRPGTDFESRPFIR